MNKKTTLGDWNITTTLFTNIPPHTKYPHETHSAIITDERELRNGLTEADGILIHKDSQPVAVATADCLPMVIDAGEKAVVIHISRKTLVAGILDNIEDIINVSEISNIYLGPHICEKHFTFEYEGEQITRFKEKFPNAFTEQESIHLSLRKAVQSYLDKWEIEDNQIVSDDRCTFEETKLPSYTMNKDITLDEELATVVSYALLPK